MERSIGFERIKRGSDVSMLIGKKLKRLLLTFLIVALAFSPIVGQENLSIAKASEEVTTNELDESASLSEKLQAILSDKRLGGAIAELVSEMKWEKNYSSRMAIFAYTPHRI